MVTIRELLEKENCSFYDKEMTWGAKVSDYKEEIERSNSEGYTPVFIELEVDLKFDFEIIIIDHHNEKSGTEQPSALRQIFSLLKLPEQSWDRWFSLVDANDKGYIDGMKSINASQEEIELVRRKDREAQKITKQQEEEAITAIQNKRIFNNDLVIIDCPHSKNATITDRMSLEDSRYQNLLIISPEEINFYGQGKLIHALVAQFPNSWHGGNLPDSGYWGSNQEDFFDVTEFIKKEVS